MIEVYPTKFEAYQDGDLAVFRVEAFDEFSAQITISSVVSLTEWDEISPLIRQCLVDMQFDGDNDKGKEIAV